MGARTEWPLSSPLFRPASSPEMVHEGGRPQNEPGDDDRKQDPAQGIAGEVPTVVSQPVHESSAESSSGLVTGASLQERAPDLLAERIDADGLIQPAPRPLLE